MQEQEQMPNHSPTIPLTPASPAASSGLVAPLLDFASSASLDELKALWGQISQLTYARQQQQLAQLEAQLAELRPQLAQAEEELAQSDQQLQQRLEERDALELELAQFETA